MDESLVDRSYLGELEALVILACLQAGEEAYAVPVRAEIERRTGRRMSRGTVYVTLERLERKGFLASSRGDPRPERGGKARRYFTVLPAGIEELRRSQNAFRAMSAGLAELAGES